MIKKCFTINQHRTTEEFKSYEELIENKLFSAIEIFYPYDKTEEEMEMYKQNIFNLMKYDIEVVLHLPHGNKSNLCNPHTFNEVMERFKKAIDFSKQFNVKKLTLHLGGFDGNDQNVSREELVNKCIENVKVLADYCYPQHLMIENMPASNELGYSPDEIEYIITKANRNNVKFIFDFGHANVSEYHIEEYIEKLSNHLMHLHISDNDGSRDQHQRIGTGNINYKNIFKLLSFYKELYCLEIIYQDVNDLIMYEQDLNNVICEENEK